MCTCCCCRCDANTGFGDWSLKLPASGSTSLHSAMFTVQVAKQVQPIMRKHCWTVTKLSEFSPR